MIVEFNILFNMVKLDMTIEYESDELNFSNRIQATPDNIRYLLNRFNSIDRISKVTFTCRELLEITHEDETFPFKLDATIYFYPSRPLVAWTPDREIPDWLTEIMAVHLSALRPTIIGTARHYLPELKAAAKATVKANANRRARIMRSNAEAIMTFLGEDFT
jgi:hypothetical protein